MYKVFNTNTGSIVSKHRSAEAAERKIEQANNSLRRNPAFANSFTPWDVCAPDQSILNAGQIYRGRNGDAYQAIDNNAIAP
jgi:hypothetical protein